MFDKLTEKISSIVKSFSTKGMLSESDVNEAIRNIRLSLLEADVALEIVKDISESVKNEAQSQNKISGLLPEHIFLKVFKDKISSILSLNHKEFAIHKRDVMLMVGLQGSGKTTTAVKIACHIKNKYGFNVLLVSIDTYRPAARDQLRIFAQKNEVSVFENESSNKSSDAISILKNALKFYNSSREYDCLIIDTAGRSQLNDEMLSELKEAMKLSNPQHKILVADAMLGQDAINIAKGFDKYCTGTVLSRVDGDSRGGAALSFSYVTQKPIFFMGVGEKVSDLEVFDPVKFASRIMGNGNLISLAENVISSVKEEDAMSMMDKMKSGNFTLEDMESQMSLMNKMGGVSKIINMLPMQNISNDKKEAGMVMIKKNKAILQSMTKNEKRNVSILNGSRKLRIANGSGTTVTDVNSLINQYKNMAKMMRTMSTGGMMNKFMSKMTKMKR